MYMPSAACSASCCVHPWGSQDAAQACVKDKRLWPGVLFPGISMHISAAMLPTVVDERPCSNHTSDLLRYDLNNTCFVVQSISALMRAQPPAVCAVHPIQYNWRLALSPGLVHVKKRVACVGSGCCG